MLHYRDKRKNNNMENKLNKLSKSISLMACYGLLAFASCESTAQEHVSTENLTVTEVALAKDGQETNPNLKKIITDTTLAVESVPEIPVAGKAFKSGYTVSAKDKHNKARADFVITVTYPVEKTADGYKTETVDITTNEEGIAVFKPENVYKTSMYTTITFAPSAQENASLAKLCEQKSVSAKFMVSYDFVNNKGIHLIDMVDYDEKGKMVLNAPITTSSNLLVQVWKTSGVQYCAQNFDCHDAVDANNPKQVYDTVQKLIMGSKRFKDITYGKVEYVNPIEKVEDGYSLTLKTTVYVLNLETGKIVHEMTKTATVVTKNQWEALKACQIELSKKITDELICVF